MGPIRLSGVPETMLQTLYARAKESRGRGAVHDPEAEKIVDGLDYDFSSADRDTAMRDGVIDLACGLDARRSRMRGYGYWYDLDLPGGHRGAGGLQ
ncbi:hypothetical protein [Pseudoflavonifractor sp. MSJ-37]|uniref:hypothetical protein n=1 Tax=Pseudoflavonifractor sp. MSJ-37 TaxID=2841531 RepID=UPI001C10AE2C|nr:hypothetical protein [Pseudoflavonifractor sp. MSJ-37]MBU5435049.1 hypothetical protein [Pseudoflavonifractor sp. MSJ-37]